MFLKVLQRRVALPAGAIAACHFLWHVAEVVHTWEWLLEHAHGVADVARVVTGGLAWMQFLPAWLVVACFLYFLCWLIVGLVYRPKLTLRYLDDGTPVNPGGQWFEVENRGLDDALNVSFDSMVVGGVLLEPKPIQHLRKLGDPASVKCDATPRPQAINYDRSFAEQLSFALHALDVIGKDQAEVVAAGAHMGTIERTLVVNYRGLMTGMNYKQRFLVRFSWAVAKFDQVEMK